MEDCARRAFALLQKIGFERVSGTPEELRAARILLDEARALGVQAELEPFCVRDGAVSAAAFTVLEPFEKAYPVSGYLRSAPAEARELEFLYAEDMTDANLTAAKGKLVLINGRLQYEGLEKLQKAGAAGVMTFSGGLYDEPDKTDLEIRKLRPLLTDAFGDMLALNLRAADALALVRDGARRVRVTVRSEQVERQSHNVCAVLPGARLPEEIVSFGAHYDSVLFSAGVYDNGAGAVILMELLRHFAAHPPARTLHFNWYGSEEQGLLGSKYHAQAHQGDLARHRLMINVDVAGAVLGSERAVVTGEQRLEQYVDSMMREAGLPVVVSRDIYSSDSIPFAEQGVPAVNFGRFAAPGGAAIHSRYDRLDALSPDALASTLRVARTFADRVVNAAVFPFERIIPDDIAEKVDKYLKKKK